MALQVSSEVPVYSTHKLSGFHVNSSVLTIITQVTFNWLPNEELWRDPRDLNMTERLSEHAHCFRLWSRRLFVHHPIVSSLVEHNSNLSYPSNVISNILKQKFSKPPTLAHAIPTPEELVCMFFKWAAPCENPNSLAVLSFINGVTQPLTRILRRHDTVF